MQEKALFSNAFLQQQPLPKRLFSEFVESSREFRQSPKAYLAAAFRDDGIGSSRRKELLRFGMAVGVLVFSTAFFFAVIFPQMFGNADAQQQDELVQHARIMTDIGETPEVEAPKADTRAGGGGGGGRQEITPPSQGRPPDFSMQAPLVAPTTHVPEKPALLPIQQTVQVDPALQPKFDPNMAIGLPQGAPGPPSDGPGVGGGIGTGEGGGVGSGRGTGLGPGEGWNTGGGRPGLGGGDNADGTAKVVDSKPRLLNNPRPLYTEEARKNKIQGSVRVRVLVNSDGSVKSVRIQTHLPDGLDEQAIAAAYKLRFTPAMRAGSPVAYWVPVEIEFNLR